jgi:hypothetical protein
VLSRFAARRNASTSACDSTVDASSMALLAAISELSAEPATEPDAEVDDGAALPPLNASNPMKPPVPARDAARSALAFELFFALPLVLGILNSIVGVRWFLQLFSKD